MFVARITFQIVLHITLYRSRDPNHSAVGVRMGTLGGSYRQKSFFDQDDYQPSSANKVSAHAHTIGQIHNILMLCYLAISNSINIKISCLHLGRWFIVTT